MNIDVGPLEPLEEAERNCVLRFVSTLVERSAPTSKQKGESSFPPSERFLDA